MAYSTGIPDPDDGWCCGDPTCAFTCFGRHHRAKKSISLLEWYFRLGSTNSKVNEYQFDNLPCPVFRETAGPEDRILLGRAREALESDPLDSVRQVAPALATAPFGLAALDLLETLAHRIRGLEQQREAITRSERAVLCPEAEPYQRALDLLLMRLAGLSDSEIAGIEERLEQML
jgi:hypothetical protein